MYCLTYWNRWIVEVVSVLKLGYLGIIAIVGNIWISSKSEV